MKKTILIVFLAVFLLSLVVSAQTIEDTGREADLSGDDVQQVTSKLLKIIHLLQYLASFLAAIAAIIVGIMFMLAKDPSEKRQNGERLKAIIIGLVIVVLSIPLVNLIVG